MRKVLVTGSNGFIGKNLICKLMEIGKVEIKCFDKGNTKDELVELLKDVDFIYHLAGVNRPQDQEEYTTGNVGLTEIIIKELERLNKQTPIMITSSIQAELNNAYGISKKLAEDRVREYGKKNDVKVYIYRLPNVFGKWCKPNYNSAVATFCYNIAHNLDVWISDTNKQVTLAYIDDVIEEFINIENKTYEYDKDYYSIPEVFTITLGKIVSILEGFRDIRNTSIIPNLSNKFTKYLYSTYLSYLDNDNFSYNLDKRDDSRGWLTEILKSKEFGQVFISKTHKGIVRGNHYHHTKVEKFIVIQGKAVIKLRKIDSEEVLEFNVTGDEAKVVDIPPGYTHSIENVGDEELITLFWANEIFDKQKADTYFNEV